MQNLIENKDSHIVGSVYRLDLATGSADGAAAAGTGRDTVCLWLGRGFSNWHVGFHLRRPAELSRSLIRWEESYGRFGAMIDGLRERGIFKALMSKNAAAFFGAFARLSFGRKVQILCVWWQGRPGTALLESY